MTCGRIFLCQITVPAGMGVNIDFFPAPDQLIFKGGMGHL